MSETDALMTIVFGYERTGTAPKGFADLETSPGGRSASRDPAEDQQHE